MTAVLELSSDKCHFVTKFAAGKVPDAPAELKEWGQQTAIGLYFGLLVGGSRQYFRHRSAGGLCQGNTTLLPLFGHLFGALLILQCRSLASAT